MPPLHPMKLLKLNFFKASHFRLHRPTVWKTLAASLAVLVILGSLLAYIEKRTAEVQCTGEIARHNIQLSYVLITVQQQHPREPFFHGEFDVMVNEFHGQPFPILSLHLSADRGFGPSIYQVPMKVREPHEFMVDQHGKINLITERGLHQMFPYDSAQFDFDITLSPDLPIQDILIRNSVPGFLFQCSSLEVKRTNNTIHIRFEFDRDPFVQLLFMVQAVASLIFTVLIIGTVNKIEALATSVASFFFSIWTMRNIMASEIHTFPTWVDYWAYFISCVILVCLVWKAAAGKIRL
jgi:hypothetical protein